MHREAGRAGALRPRHRQSAFQPELYAQSNMEFPERFRWGWCPTTGKKGDLMFAQHMLAVCKPGGMVTTVMPHGVLFRGGAEKEIRQEISRTGPHRGHHWPAPEPVLRRGHPGLHPGDASESHRPVAEPQQARRAAVARCSSSMPMPSSTPAARRTTCVPSTWRKSSPLLTASRTCPATPGVVSLEEIGSPANDWNLNIRRYVDNSPPPEPHDVRAHLHGRCACGRGADKTAALRRAGLRPRACLRRADERRCLLRLRARASLTAPPSALLWKMIPVCRPVLDKLYAMPSRHGGSPRRRLADLPARRDLNAVRTEFLEHFVAALSPLRYARSLQARGCHRHLVDRHAARLQDPARKRISRRHRRLGGRHCRRGGGRRSGWPEPSIPSPISSSVTPWPTT